MDLPPHVHRVKRGEKVYLFFQKHRNTAQEGPRVRLPDDSTSPAFWQKYRDLSRKRATDPVGEKTVSAMIAAYRKTPEFTRLKPTTQKTYDHYLDLFERRLGKFDAKLVTPRVLLEVRDSLAETPVKANALVSIVGTCFKASIPRGFAEANPARDIIPIQIRSDGYDPWPEWAIGLVLKEARWEVQMFTALALYTGQRSGDVVRMRLQDIDGNKIAVRQGKTDKTLMIRIHRDLAPYIAEARTRGFMNMVPGPDGKPYDTNLWRSMWQRELAKEKFARIAAYNAEEKEAGRNGVVPHGLRKSAVVKLREAGCSIEEIMAITGQSRPIVEHYAKKVDQAMMADRGITKWEGGSAENKA